MQPERMQVMALALVFLVMGWALLAWVYAGDPVVLAGGAVAVLFGVLLRVGLLRPWTDLLAWLATGAALLMVGWPPEPGLVAATLVTLALALILVGLHAPRRASDTRGLAVAAAWWVVAAVLVGLIAWWPVVALEGKDIGVLDPATSVGMALRLVFVLVLLSLAVLGLGALRSRSARRKSRGDEPPRVPGPE